MLQPLSFRKASLIGLLGLPSSLVESTQHFLEIVSGHVLARIGHEQHASPKSNEFHRSAWTARERSAREARLVTNPLLVQHCREFPLVLSFVSVLHVVRFESRSTYQRSEIASSAPRQARIQPRSAVKEDQTGARFRAFHPAPPATPAAIPPNRTF